MFIRFIVFFVVVQGVLALVHYFLYRTGVWFFALSDPRALMVLRWSIGGLAVSFTLAMLFARRVSGMAADLLYTAAAGWLGLFLLALWASVALWVLLWLSHLTHLPEPGVRAAATAFGIAVVLFVYGAVHASSPVVTRTRVKLPYLPDAWRDKTVVWVSDVHLGNVYGRAFAERVVRAVEGEKPEAIFVGGDLFDGAPIAYADAVSPFARLMPPHGMYFVTGNHEEFGDSAPYLEAARSAGMRVLDGERVDLAGLQVIGVDYLKSRDERYLRELFSRIGIVPTQPSVLLSHAPTNLAITQEAGISLQLSGHTHHGQVFPFRYLTSLIYQGYDYGLARYKNLQVLTSSGVGTWGPPIRIGTKPEVLAVTFE